jgi:hypothetical protein
MEDPAERGKLSISSRKIIEGWNLQLPYQAHHPPALSVQLYEEDQQKAHEDENSPLNDIFPLNW